MGPMPLRKFEQLVKSHGCHIERSSKEWVIVDSYGAKIVPFAVTHGKQRKRNEVKPIYVKQFLKAIKNIGGAEV